MNYDILKYWIALKSIAGVGNITFPVLVDKFGSLPAIFAAPVSELRETLEFPKISPQPLLVLKIGIKLKKNLNLLTKTKFNIITYQDELYPQKLMNIYDRPPFFMFGAI